MELMYLLLSLPSGLQGSSQAGLHVLVSKPVTGEPGSVCAGHASPGQLSLPRSIWWQRSVGGVPMETKRMFDLFSLLIQFELSSSGLNLNS